MIVYLINTGVEKDSPTQKCDSEDSNQYEILKSPDSGACIGINNTDDIVCNGNNEEGNKEVTEIGMCTSQEGTACQNSEALAANNWADEKAKSEEQNNSNEVATIVWSSIVGRSHDPSRHFPVTAYYQDDVSSETDTWEKPYSYNDVRMTEHLNEGAFYQ